MAFLQKLRPKSREYIKRQRDRFLAFAFSSADLFLEVSPGHKITYAIGAPMSMTGLNDEDMVGKNWLELFDVSEHGKLSQLKEKSIPGVRCGPIIVLLNKENNKRRVMITGMKLPDRESFYASVCFNDNELLKAIEQKMKELGIDPLTTGYTPPDESFASMVTGFEAEDISDTTVTTDFEGEDEKDTTVTTDFKAEDKQDVTVTTGFEAEDKNEAELTTDFEAEGEKDTTVTTDFVPEEKADTTVTTDFTPEKQEETTVTTDFTPEKDEKNVVTTGYKADDISDQTITTGFVPEDDGLGEAMFNNTEFMEESQRIFEHAKEHGIETSVTVFDFGRTETIPEENWAEMIGKISTMLRDNSVGGRAATEISEGKYSLIHDESQTAESLKREIANISKEMDPAGEGVEISSKTLETNLDEMTGKEASRSLFYAIREFEKSGTNFIVEGLKQGFKALVTDNTEKVAELENIIRRVDFNLHFQPVVSIKNMEVHHYEILCRFKQGNTPEWFMLAEDSGLAPEFDSAVIDRVINHIKHKGGVSRTKFSVNISQKSLLDDEFVEELHEKLSYEATLKDRMFFEITHAGNFDDPNKTKQFIKDLQEKGFTIGLDDFGISENAADILKKLQVDFIKIDEKYIRKLTSSTRTAKLVKKTAKHCKELGILVVAEFVESQAESDLLEELGVQFGQGYYFGKAENAPMFIPPRK